MMAPIVMPGVVLQGAPALGLFRALLIGLAAFLTVVDLFATQAILPALTQAYGTTPALMSLAVNASTIGMAIAGLAVAQVKASHRVLSVGPESRAPCPESRACQSLSNCFAIVCSCRLDVPS